MAAVRALVALATLVVLAGCGEGGGKIEPSAKGGSPILNKSAAAPTPGPK